MGRKSSRITTFICVNANKIAHWLCVVVVLVTGILGLSVNGAFAEEKPTVYFAGMAFLGNFSDTSTAFPFSSKLFAEKNAAGVPLLNIELNERLRNRTFESFNLSTALGQYKSGNGLALAFALTWENVGQEKYDGFTKLTVDLQAEALVFDITKMEVISSYPFGIQYIDSVYGAASNAKIASIVRTLFLGNQSNNIFEKFLGTLQNLQVKQSYGARIQVKGATLEAPAIDGLSAVDIQADAAKELLISSFERYLSKNANIPVLPHTEDQAIGNTIKARFSESDVYNLTIPDPDYAIHLDLTNVRKVNVGQSASRIAWAYASYLNVKIVQPLSQRELLSANFKYPVVKELPIEGATPDDRSGFQESLMAISDQVTRQLATPNSDWLDKWLVTPDSSDEMSKMPDLLARCR